METERLVRALLRAMEWRGRNRWVAAEFLAKFAVGHGLRQVALEMLQMAATEDEELREIILRNAHMLYKLAPDETRRLLLKCVRDRDDGVRGEAVTAIGKIVSEAEDDELLNALVEMAGQEDDAYELLGIIRRFLPANKEGVVQIIERALQSSDIDTQMRALHIAEKIHFCNDKVENAILRLLPQTDEVIPIAYELGIHLKHPESFLRIDGLRVHDWYISRYVQALCNLCDLEETRDVARKKLAEVVEKRYWDRGWILFVVMHEGKMDGLWDLFWETLDFPGRDDRWILPLAEVTAHQARNNAEIAEMVLSALEQGGNRGAFALVVLEQLFSITLGDDDDDD